MNEIETRVRAAIRDGFRQIAPEVDVDEVDPEADLREEVDLDSVDAINLMVHFHESLGVEIPESDYGKITTLDAMVGYLTGRLAGQE